MIRQSHLRILTDTRSFVRLRIIPTLPQLVDWAGIGSPWKGSQEDPKWQRAATCLTALRHCRLCNTDDGIFGRN
jgi:hypothetical protein